MRPTQRLEWLRRYGADPIAVSALQPGLSYFDAPEGFVPYQRAFGVALSLGGPICAPEARVALARRFLAQVPGSALFYVERELAEAVGGLSFRAALGSDRVLDLRAVDTLADSRVQAAARKAAKAGFALEPLDLARASSDELAFLQRVTACALERSVAPFEMRFLNRPMTYEAGGPERIFALSQKGQRFGYAVLDPCFRDGVPSGYLLNLIRFEPTSIWGVYLAVVHALAGLLQAEGVHRLSLGFCPLRELDIERSSAPMRPQLRYLARHYAAAPYLERLHTMKSAFGGAWASRWLVGRSPQLLTPFLALLELSGASVLELARERLAAPRAA
jgi:lysylphosphatidylglycerol synthetase-like protein (DUF2156 family)